MNKGLWIGVVWGLCVYPIPTLIIIGAVLIFAFIAAIAG